MVFHTDVLNVLPKIKMSLAHQANYLCLPFAQAHPYCLLFSYAYDTTWTPSRSMIACKYANSSFVGVRNSVSS